MQNDQNYLRSALKQLGGAWGWILAFGLLGIAAGLCMFFFTGQALHVIAIAFGVWLIAYGVFRFVGAWSVPGENGWMRALYGLLSAVAVAAGVYLVAHPALSLLTLTLTIGFFWIFAGMVELFVGVGMSGLPGRGWAIFGGIVGIIAGWVIIFTPGISTVALALLLGFWLVVYGITVVVAAFRVRSGTAPVRAALTPRRT